MSNITNMPLPKRPVGGSSSGAGGGNPGDVDERISELEKSLIAITTTLPFLATKADVKGETSTVVMWLVGTALAAGVFFYDVIKESKDAAAPNSVPAVVVNLQAAPGAQPPAPTASK